ncbi:MAG: hypothetical protein J2P19_22535 [Pseudonocardia sp.]|nr:hypothetical protein [Pseudonocardia sp.]
MRATGVREFGGPVEVLDYHDEGWPERVRELTGGPGVDAARLRNRAALLENGQL